MKGNRAWLIGGLVVALVVVGISWFALINPKRSDTADTKAQTDTVRAANTQLRQDLAALNSQKAQLQDKQASIGAVGKQVPDDPETAGLLRTLRRTAEDSNVKITSITPAAPTSAVPLVTGSAPYASITLDVVIIGDFTSLKYFLNNVEQIQRVVVPVSIDLKPVDDGDLILTMSARTYTTDTASIDPIQLPQLATSASASPSASATATP